MPLFAPRSVIRRWLEGTPRRPLRTRRPLQPLAVERLEDRVNPTNSVDSGGLRFVSDAGFTREGGEAVARSGAVSIGYVPTGSEKYLALVRVDVGSGIGAGEVAVNTGTPSFGITGGKMALTVVGDKISPPIPIWQTPDSTERVNFFIPTLIGGGVTLSDARSSAVEVASVDFTLNLLEFVNPHRGDTSDAKVQMQGNVTFDQLPVTNGLNGAKFEVNGVNYVVADKQGIILTGIEATRSLPSDSTMGGMHISGTVTLGYSNPDHLFTFGGGIELSSDPQGEHGKVGFDGVGAELNFTLAEANKKLEIRKLGFAIDESFELFDLTVSTTAGEPLAFQYDFDQHRFEVSGGLQAEFRGNSVGVSFGNAGNPGLIIEDGVVTELSAEVVADFKLFGASVSTNAGNGLNFEYDREKDQFEMYGGLSLSIPSADAHTTITAQMGTSADDPGLVIVDGKLKALDLALSGSFDVFDLALGVNNAGIKWVSADDTLEIFGDYTADFEVFQTNLQLGTDSKNPGITIKHGHFVVDSVSFELVGAELGPLTLNDLKVSYTAVGNSFDLGVDVNVGLPGGWTAIGDFELVNGRLDSISLTLPNPSGIAIGDTGLFLTEIAASVKNLENPSQIVVSGRMDVVFGETVKMFGQSVNLFHAEGQFTVDANELILDCGVQLGAYSTDGGNTWRGVLGQADGKLTLDWHDNLYSLHIEADGLLAVFDVEGDIVFAAGKDIQLLATATVVVPEWVPFVGGDKLGGFGFYFEHVWPQPHVASSTTLAAWIDLDVIWPFTVGFEVVIDGDGNRHSKLIGGGTVNEFKQSVQQNDQMYTFATDLTNQVPAAATSAVLSADWSRSVAGVTILERPKFRVQQVLNGNTQTFTEDQFAANGISLLSDARFNGPTSAAIQIVGSTTDPDAPIAGDYTLLVDIKAEGGIPFPSFPNPHPQPGQDYLNIQATYHIPNPTFGPIGSNTPAAPQLSTTSPTRTFAATVAGSIDEAYLPRATVNLYRVRVNDPFQRGVLVGTSKLTAITPAGGLNWTATFEVPIDGLGQTGYTLYAVLNDGFSTPKPGEPNDGSNAPGRAIQSANSAQFTPDFAVVTSVLNQNDDPEFGWDVYLDYNSNAKHDANEPIVETNREGVVTFTRSFAPSTGWDPVPVGRQFDVRLVVPPQSRNFGPFETSIPLVYGDSTRNVRFTPQEKSAIKGNVFVDLLNDGNAAHGRGAGGAIVYIDANGNGRRDPGEPTAVANATGDYAFADVAPGKYRVALDPTSLSLTTPTAAYVVPAGTLGNQANDYTYGMVFDVDKPTVVTSLGVFDSGGDGFSGTMTAVLYDATTKVVVARQTFTPGAPGTLRGGTRFLRLANPVTLMPGFRGIIAAYGFNDKDRAANNVYRDPNTPPPWTNNAGNGQITFLNGNFAATPDTVPDIADASPYPNPYAAGSFLFREAPWDATSPGAKPYTVTVGTSGFDLREGKDFGVLPPSFIAGNVSGHALANGQPQSGTTPLASWAVQLLTDTPVIRIHAGGSAIGNYVADTGFTGGGSSATTAEIDTSRVFNPAPKEVYQICRFGSNATRFSYTITGQTPGQALAVRLHFAEPHWGAPGERQFNVTINGQRVLSNFDAFAAAGGINTAVVQSFDTFADADGNVTIKFNPGAIGDPFVNGIELFEPGTVVATTTTDVQGNYVFTQHTPGNYTVREVPPPGWRQVSPFHSDLEFTTSPLPTRAYQAPPVVADFNGDGYADFALAFEVGPEFGGFVRVFINQKNNTFAPAERYDAGSVGDPTIAAADLNGDGRIDLAVLAVPDDAAGVPSSVGAFINTGRNTPGQRFQFVPNFWNVPAAFTSTDDTLAFPTRADLNGDKLDDLVLGYNTNGSTSASVLVLLNSAQPSGRTVTEYKLPRADVLGNDHYDAGPVVVADFNGDGFQDVFVNGGMNSPEYSHLNLGLGNGKGILAPWQSYDLDDSNGATGGPTAAGDITGGGLPSMVVTDNFPSQGGSWFYNSNYAFNRGDGSFRVQFGTSQKFTPLAPGPTGVQVKDVNGDLRPDLVYLLAGGTGVASLLVYLNVGTAPYYEFASPLVFPVGGGTYKAENFAVADVNNDGLLDVLVTGSSGGRLVLNQSKQNQPGLPVFLGAGAIKSGADFVNVQKPSRSAVHGQVYEDANRNGRRDTGETGTAGAVVFVDLNGNGRLDPAEPSGTTIGHGLYTISGVPDGKYPVVVARADAWRTPASPAFVTVRNGSISRLDPGRTRRLLQPVADQTVTAGQTLAVEVAAAEAASGRVLRYTLEGRVPAGASIDPATGRFTWTPHPDKKPGIYRIAVRVRDPFDTTFTETAEFAVRVIPSRVDY